MLDSLKDNLRLALKKIVGASDINEELINELCKDLQRALLVCGCKCSISVRNNKKS